MTTNLNELIEPIELISPFGDIWADPAPPPVECNTGVIVTCQKGWKR